MQCQDICMKVIDRHAIRQHSRWTTSDQCPTRPLRVLFSWQLARKLFSNSCHSVTGCGSSFTEKCIVQNAVIRWYCTEGVKIQCYGLSKGEAKAKESPFIYIYRKDKYDRDPTITLLVVPWFISFHKGSRFHSAH